MLTHALLHRHQMLRPEDPLFAPDTHAWWLSLPVDPLECARIQTDLDTLAFARRQIAAHEACLATVAAADERVPFLVQTTGISLITALTHLARIGARRPAHAYKRRGGLGNRPPPAPLHKPSHLQR